MSSLRGFDLGLIERARLGRRGFLGLAGAALLAACAGDDGVGTTDGTAATTSTAGGEVLASDPFTLGVASGAPLADGVVLWTRLAPDPAAGGGMPAADVAVRWEVAADESFGDIVDSGEAVAVAEFAHSVHLDVRGLDSDRPYWYRFMVGEFETPVARTRTAPAADEMAERLLVGQVSCQSFGSGWYTAYADLATEMPDLVAHCGDYIYEGSGGAVREVHLPDPVTLDHYRDRYGLYKGDPDLQAAHAVAPWLIVWDDHEVEDNYQGTSPAGHSSTPDPDEFLVRRAAAYRAWWEHMPVRIEPPTGPDLTIHGTVPFGRLASFHLLDTRQYRHPQECADPEAAIGDVGPRCEASFDPNYTVIGSDQESWLGDTLAESDARWNVLVQQIVMQQWRFAPGNAVWNLDQWDGYPAARDALFEQLRRSAAQNPVVLTGDVHSSWVGTLADDFDDPASAVIGTEFVGTSISSNAPGALGAIMPVVVENGPHIQWADVSKRGWVRHEITPTEWRADYRHVADATVQDSSVATETSWVIADGEGVQQA